MARFDVREFAGNLANIYSSQMQGAMAGHQQAEQQAQQQFQQQMQLAQMQDEQRQGQLKLLMGLPGQEPADLARLVQGGLNQPSPYAPLASSPYARQHGLTPYLQGMSPPPISAAASGAAPAGLMPSPGAVPPVGAVPPPWSPGPLQTQQGPAQAPVQPAAAPAAPSPDVGVIQSQFGPVRIGGGVDKKAVDNAYREMQRLNTWAGTAQLDPSERILVQRAAALFPTEIKSKEDLRNAQAAIQEMHLHEMGNAQGAYTFRENQRKTVGSEYQTGLKALTDPKTSPAEFIGRAKQLRGLERTGAQYEDLNPTGSALEPFDDDLKEIDALLNPPKGPDGKPLTPPDRQAAMAKVAVIQDQIRKGIDPKQEASAMNSFINYAKLLSAKQLSDPKFMRATMQKFGLGKMVEGVPDAQIPFLAGGRVEGELGKLIRQATKKDFATLDSTSQKLVLDRIAELKKMAGSSVTVPSQVVSYMTPYQQWVMGSSNIRLQISAHAENRKTTAAGQTTVKFGERIPEQYKDQLGAIDDQIRTASKAMEQAESEYVIDRNKVLSQPAAADSQVEKIWRQNFQEVGRLMGQRENVFMQSQSKAAQPPPPDQSPLPAVPSVISGKQPPARRTAPAAGAAGAAGAGAAGPSFNRSPLPNAAKTGITPPGTPTTPTAPTKQTTAPSGTQRFKADTPVSVKFKNGGGYNATRASARQAFYDKVKDRKDWSEAKKQAYVNANAQAHGLQ